MGECPDATRATSRHTRATRHCTRHAAYLSELRINVRNIPNVALLRLLRGVFCTECQRAALSCARQQAYIFHNVTRVLFLQQHK